MHETLPSLEGSARDLEALHAFILVDSPEAADRFVNRLRDAIEQLADHPGLGHRRADLTSRALLFWPVGSYLIVYRADRKPLGVVAVVHAAGDVATLLGDRD